MNTASATELRGRCGPAAESLFQSSAAGIVCGVFSSALYCDFESEILLFHSCAYGEVPFGAALDDVKSFLAACQASAGDTITLQPDGFSLGGKNYILCQTAAGIPRPSGHILPPDPSRLAAIYAFVRENGSPRGMLSLLETDPAAKGAVPALESAFCLGDAAAARQAAWRLVGRGRGLTPSGDDFLCGFFQTLYAARAAGLPVPEIADTCAAELSGALNRTSRISGAYFRHALLGSYFTIYDASARTVLGGADFRTACSFVFGMGASSGTDTLLGALSAARVLSAYPPKPHGYTS